MTPSPSSRDPVTWEDAAKARAKELENMIYPEPGFDQPPLQSIVATGFAGVIAAIMALRAGS